MGSGVESSAALKKLRKWLGFVASRILVTEERSQLESSDPRKE